jgi:type IV secretory pathway TrbD component
MLQTNLVGVAMMFVWIQVLLGLAIWALLNAPALLAARAERTRDDVVQ